MMVPLVAKFAIYTVLILLLFWGIRKISYLIVFDGTEKIYPILRWLDLSGTPIILLVLLIGYIIIFLKLWKATLGYILEIMHGVEKVFSLNNELIELPDGLKEIESVLNKSKYRMNENIKITQDTEQKKNDLLVYLAHDLKTPLTSVLGYVFLLKTEKNISEDAQSHYLDIVYKKAEQLEVLIDELFEITRFSITKIGLKKRSTNLSLLIEQLIFEFKPMFKEKDLISCLSLEKEIYVKCDSNRIQRVFENILRNAINYSYENTKVDIILVKKESYVEIIFINSGNTILESHLERVFEQFYRIDASRNSKTGGAGLGLAIAKEIVEAHNGVIEISSKQNKTKVLIKFPIL